MIDKTFADEILQELGKDETTRRRVDMDRQHMYFSKYAKGTKVSRGVALHPVQQIRLQNLHNGLPVRIGGRHYRYGEVIG